MDVVIATLIFLLGIFGNVVASELYDCCRPLSRWVIRKSAARLPTEFSGRYCEEWLAHLEECPGGVTGLWHALGCFRCAAKIAPKPLFKRQREKIAAMLVLIASKLIDRCLASIMSFAVAVEARSEIEGLRNQIREAQEKIGQGDVREGFRLLREADGNVEKVLTLLRSPATRASPPPGPPPTRRPT